MHIGLNAHLLSGQKGYRAAGIHGYIYNLLHHLPKAAPSDWRFTAMVGKGNPHQFQGMTRRPGPLVTEAPVRRILWEQAIQPWSLGQYDLYHALAFVSPVLLNRPSVVTVYDLSFLHFPEGLTLARRLYLRLFTALSCRRAERVIAISHSTAQDIQENLNISPDKIDVATGGYDTARYIPLPQEHMGAFRQAHHLPKRFWFYLGTLEPRKNLATLLDAYAQLPSYERLPLFIGGDKGWMYEPIMARIDKLPQVFYMGFIPTEDLPLWYNSAEVFLFPSIYEGFGLPVLEAMACGTPVITSDASSLPEVAGDAGLCLPPFDQSAWVEALHKAYQDAQWREEVRERGLLGARRYNWFKTATQTVTSYQKILV